jgi:hypothetical protein
MLDFEENNADQFISDKSFKKSLLLKKKEFVKRSFLFLQACAHQGCLLLVEKIIPEVSISYFVSISVFKGPW